MSCMLRAVCWVAVEEIVDVVGSTDLVDWDEVEVEVECRHSFCEDQAEQ